MSCVWMGAEEFYPIWITLIGMGAGFVLGFLIGLMKRDKIIEEEKNDRH